jgi:glutathione S-transferase
MQLLDNPASPYCRKVKVLLYETDLITQVDLVETGGHPTEPNAAAQAHNPLGKIPTLLRPDGPSIYDSRVICRYLDSKAHPSLYPESRLWDVMTIEATADGIMDAAVLMVYEARSRPEDKRDPTWVNAQWSKIEAALGVLEARWMSHLNGPLDMGQIAVGCALGYLDFRHGDRNWRNAHTSLAAWYEAFAQRHSMIATLPPTG